MCLTYIPLLKYRTFTMLVFIPEFVNTFLSTLLMSIQCISEYNAEFVPPTGSWMRTWPWVVTVTCMRLSQWSRKPSAAVSVGPLPLSQGSCLDTSTKRHQCTLKTNSSPSSCAVSDFIIINTCKCFECFVLHLLLNVYHGSFVLGRRGA